MDSVKSDPVLMVEGFVGSLDPRFRPAGMPKGKVSSLLQKSHRKAKERKSKSEIKPRVKGGRYEYTLQ